MQKDEEILQEIERSFLPLRCVAEIWYDGAQLRFRVFDALGQTLRTRNLKIEQAQHRATLQGFIKVDRDFLQRKGHKLNPLP